MSMFKIGDTVRFVKPDMMYGSAWQLPWDEDGVVYSVFEDVAGSRSGVDDNTLVVVTIGDVDSRNYRAYMCFDYYLELVEAADDED